MHRTEIRQRSFPTRITRNGGSDDPVAWRKRRRKKTKRILHGGEEVNSGEKSEWGPRLQPGSRRYRSSPWKIPFAWKRGGSSARIGIPYCGSRCTSSDRGDENIGGWPASKQPIFSRQTSANWKTRSLHGVGKGTLVRSSRRLGVGWNGFGSFFSLFLSFLYRVSKLGRDVCLSIPEKKLLFGSKDSFYRRRGWRWWIRFSKREGEFVINRCFSSLLFLFSGSWFVNEEKFGSFPVFSGMLNI